MMQTMLTTADNPYDPFSEFDEWYANDHRLGHHTLGLLARFVRTSDELSEADQARALEVAIDELIENDELDLYRKVQSDS